MIVFICIGIYMVLQLIYSALNQMFEELYQMSDKGCCLKCKKVFDGGKTKSLCPDCLAVEFRNMDNGDPSGYLYAAMEYHKRCGKG